MDNYCKKFEGGYCKKVKMNVPRDWCFDVCGGHWDGKRINPPETLPFKELSFSDMIIHASKALKRAAQANFKTVSKETAIERQVCCTTCGGSGRRCKYCGCWLDFKKLLSSEKKCPDKETYPRMKVEPPRNYWAVCNEMTSVIIPARNESQEYLQNTINSIFDNFTGQFEIIIALDGYDIPLDKRCKSIKFTKPVGRREAINFAVKQSKGKYLLHLDGHCSVSKGYDTKLKCACEDNVIAVPTISPMGETWQTREVRYTFVRLNQNLEAIWWDGHKPLSHCEPIENTMCMTGCGWMIQRDWFDKLGGFDPRLGEYGKTGPEWAIKCWANGGRLVLRTDVVCGHIFGTNLKTKRYSARAVVPGPFKRVMLEKYSDQIEALRKRFGGIERDWDKYDTELGVFDEPS